MNIVKDKINMFNIIQGRKNREQLQVMELVLLMLENDKIFQSVRFYWLEWFANLLNLSWNDRAFLQFLLALLISSNTR